MAEIVGKGPASKAQHSVRGTIAWDEGCSAAKYNSYSVLDKSLPLCGPQFHLLSDEKGGSEDVREPSAVAIYFSFIINILSDFKNVFIGF